MTRRGLSVRDVKAHGAGSNVISSHRLVFGDSFISAENRG